jgi:hypothetical protein
MAEKLAKAAGFPSIQRAIDSGLLDLHSFAAVNPQQQSVDFIADCVAAASKSPLLSQRRPQMKVRDDLVLREFVEGITSAVVDGRTFPLFDEQTSSLVKAAIDARVIAPAPISISRGAQPALAAHMLGILPHFDAASLEETLQVRGELSRWLVRFRGAIVKFAETVKAPPWDSDFTAEADVVFHRDVAPAIADIEDAIKSNRLITSIVRAFADRPLTLPAGSAIGLAISSLSALPHALTLSLGISATASIAVFDAYKTWREKASVAEQNAMYFYYRVSTDLTK